ncbi:MAG: hypothetical protein V7695_16485 [Sulfitobacter sp.]
MIDFNTTFSHNFFQVSIRDAVTHVEKYGKKDHAFGEVIPLEINHHGWALTFKNKAPHLTWSSRLTQSTKLCDRALMRDVQMTAT